MSRLRFIRLPIGPVFIAAISVGTIHCKAPQIECLAACDSEISASGAFELPDGATDVTVEFCLEKDCASSKLAVDGQGKLFCDAAVHCELVAGRLTVFRAGDLLNEPEVGDPIILTVKTGSGESLVDANVPIEEVTVGSICGDECNSASVAW